MLILRIHYIVARVIYCIAANAEALVDRCRSTYSSLCSHCFFNFPWNHANFFEIAVHLITTLKDGLIR